MDEIIYYVLSLDITVSLGCLQASGADLSFSYESNNYGQSYLQQHSTNAS